MLIGVPCWGYSWFYIRTEFGESVDIFILILTGLFFGK